MKNITNINTEILKMEELDAVAGATNGEYKEIRDILPMIPCKYNSKGTLFG